MINVRYLYGDSNFPVLIEDDYEGIHLLLPDDEALELYNKLAPIAADIIQRRADEKK